MKLNTQALSQVTIGTPVLQPGPYFVKIKQALVKAQKEPKTGQNLNLILQIAGDTVTGYDGKVHKNNGEMTLFDTVSLTLTDNYDPNKRLKELSDAIGNTSDDLELEQLKDKWVKVQVKYVPATGDFRERNQISRYQAIIPADNFNQPPY